MKDTMKNQNKLKISLILTLLISVVVWELNNRTAYAQEPKTTPSVEVDATPETTPSPQLDTMGGADMMTSMMRMMTLCADMMAMTGASQVQQGMQGMMDGSGAKGGSPDNDAQTEPNMQGMMGNFGMMDMMMQMMMGSSDMMNGSTQADATPEPDMHGMGTGS